MKQTFYILKNSSLSDGTYFYDGEYKTLYAGQEVTLEKAPSNKTANLSVIQYRKEVGFPKLLNEKVHKAKGTEIEDSKSQPSSGTSSAERS